MISAFQGVRDGRIRFMILSRSLIYATKAAVHDLPFATSRSYKARTCELRREAARAAMQGARSHSRIPATSPRPRYVPES